MGRVISSNFNALLDKAEDPKKSIELTLSEMEAQIRAARQEVVRSVAAEKQLRKKVEELDAEVDKWAKRAELAVKHDDDDLAREALIQKKRVTAERDRAEALRGEQRSNALGSGFVISPDGPRRSRGRRSCRRTASSGSATGRRRCAPSSAARRSR